MPLTYELRIRLDKHLSGQVDRLLDILEKGPADTSALDRALDRNETATRDLKQSVEANRPKK